MDVLARSGYSIVVAHLNHGLRAEAEGEAEQVQGYARKLGIDFILGKTDIIAIAQRDHLSIEEAARHERYRFLFAQAKQYKAQAVAVGHTADDQVETVLMHLLRGAGLAGLKGMLYRWLPSSWSAEIPLVRPLLGVWRTDVLDHIHSRGYQPVFDASNLDTSYFRNRLRHDLIPSLESYSPGIRQILWRTVVVLQEDYRLIEAVVGDAWQECLRESGDDYLGFSYQKIRGQPPGLQRHLIRRGMATLLPDMRDVDFETIERSIRFIKFPTKSNQVELSGNIRLTLEGDTIWIARLGVDLPKSEWPQIAPGERKDLYVPGELQLVNGWVLRTAHTPLPRMGLAEIQGNNDPYQAWIDLRNVNQPLIVRGRLVGDQFAPLGMEGLSLKVSDFMINVKLPRRARTEWPLVCALNPSTQAEEIIWVPGFRQSHFTRVTDQTSDVILLQLRKSNAV
ncbi:MAG: tRNA lysidine(34) synthetase TilS [Chloroflexi bacterium RBG_16_52_11]|nr:MAG: tRNA lysidine(34) synthetase TilS [Chloroflexi bacterium RBG_16_52_11]